MVLVAARCRLFQYFDQAEILLGDCSEFNRNHETLAISLRTGFGQPRRGVVLCPLLADLLLDFGERRLQALAAFEELLDPGFVAADAGHPDRRRHDRAQHLIDAREMLQDVLADPVQTMLVGIVWLAYMMIPPSKRVGIDYPREGAKRVPSGVLRLGPDVRQG